METAPRVTPWPKSAATEGANQPAGRHDEILWGSSLYEVPWTVAQTASQS